MLNVEHMNIGCSSPTTSLKDVNKIVCVIQVESYVEHIRNMLEERECLTAEYERDNEQLRAELEQIKHQQGKSSKMLYMKLFSHPSSTARSIKLVGLGYLIKLSTYQFSIEPAYLVF